MDNSDLLEEIERYKKEIEILIENKKKLEETIDKSKFEYKEAYLKMTEMLSLSKTTSLVEMFRSINHDIRNHLLRISQNLMNIKHESISGIKDNQDRQNLLSNIVVINNDIENVDSLIYLYEPNSFKVSYENLAEILTNVSESLIGKRSSTKHSIKVVTSFVHDSVPSLKCIRAELAMIIYNLLSNSLKAIVDKWDKFGRLRAIPEGLINVSIDYNFSEKYYHLIIEDDGIGIDKKFLLRIYELGFTTKHNGLGIRLFFVKQTVENNYSGSISCSSYLNKGTTFEIKIRDYSL